MGREGRRKKPYVEQFHEAIKREERALSTVGIWLLRHPRVGRIVMLLRFYKYINIQFDREGWREARQWFHDITKK